MIIKDQFTETEEERNASRLDEAYSEFTAARDSQALIRENKELFMMDTYYRELIAKERAAF
jgi:histidinol-phosphate/aromatic aminotransferase/cobyric acid decarboxylase-like protein